LRGHDVVLDRSGEARDGKRAAIQITPCGAPFCGKTEPFGDEIEWHMVC
jgi:hypothetical protein